MLIATKYLLSDIKRIDDKIFPDSNITWYKMSKENLFTASFAWCYLYTKDNRYVVITLCILNIYHMDQLKCSRGESTRGFHTNKGKSLRDIHLKKVDELLPCLVTKVQLIMNHCHCSAKSVLFKKTRFSHASIGFSF